MIPRLFLVTDRHATAGRPLLDVIRAALDAGLPSVQLRDKDLSGRERWQLAEALRVATRATGAQLYINDRVDIAVAVDADGVHLGETSLPIAVVRDMLPLAQRIGASTHAATAPHADGADFRFFGPVAATPAKAAFGPPQGWPALAATVRTAPHPVIAIGGMTADDVPHALAAGAHGVAVIRAILAATDPAAATRACLRALAAP